MTGLIVIFKDGPATLVDRVLGGISFLAMLSYILFIVYSCCSYYFYDQGEVVEDAENGEDTESDVAEW